MIRMTRLANGRFASKVLCDGCGEAITDTKVAHALWFVDDEFQPDGVIYHVCKGACDRFVEIRDGQGRNSMWLPLTVHLDNLLHNSGLKTVKQRRDAHETAEMWSQLP